MTRPMNFNTLSDLVKTQDKAVEFLMENNVLKSSHVCSNCNIVITHRRRDPNLNYYYYRCTSCVEKSSMRKGTFLNFKHVEPRTFVLMLYLFLFWQSASIEAIQHEVIIT